MCRRGCVSTVVDTFEVVKGVSIDHPAGEYAGSVEEGARSDHLTNRDVAVCEGADVAACEGDKCVRIDDTAVGYVRDGCEDMRCDHLFNGDAAACEGSECLRSDYLINGDVAACKGAKGGRIKNPSGGDVVVDAEGTRYDHLFNRDAAAGKGNDTCHVAEGDRIDHPPVIDAVNTDGLTILPVGVTTQVGTSGVTLRERGMTICSTRTLLLIRAMLSARPRRPWPSLSSPSTRPLHGRRPVARHLPPRQRPLVGAPSAPAALPRRITAPAPPTTTLTRSRLGALVIIGHADGTICLHEAAGARAVPLLHSHAGLLVALAFGPNRWHLASRTRGRVMRTWSTAERSLVRLSSFFVQ